MLLTALFILVFFQQQAFASGESPYYLLLGISSNEINNRSIVKENRDNLHSLFNSISVYCDPIRQEAEMPELLSLREEIEKSEVVHAQTSATEADAANPATSLTYFASLAATPDLSLTRISNLAAPSIFPGTLPVVCSGATTASLPYTATDSPTEYEIDFDATANSAGIVDIPWTTIPASPISITLPAGLLSGTYNGILRAKNADGISTDAPITITVNPTPSASISGTTTVCQNSSLPPVTFTNPGSLPINVTYKVNTGSDQTIAVPANTTSTVPAPTGTTGTYTYYLISVQYQSSPLCTTSLSGSATITVIPEPSLTSASQPATVCEGNPATILLTGLVPNSTFTVGYSINGVDQTPITGVVANGAGEASFTSASLTAGNNVQTLQITSITITSSTPNCSRNFAQNVTLSVNSKPVNPTSVTSTATSICTGESVTLTLNGGSPGTGGLIQWYSGSCGGTYIGTGASINVSPTSTTTYYGRYETGAPCNQNSECAQVTITVHPQPTLSGASQSATVCEGNPANILLTGVVPNSTFTVAYSIAGVSQTPVTGVVANGGGDASFTTVNLTAGNNGQTLQINSLTITSTTPNCTQSFTQNVTLSVNSKPVDPTSVTASANSVCPGGSSTLTLIGGSPGTGGLIQWYSGSCGGTYIGTGNNFSVTPTATTTYYGRYETGAPCSQSSNCAAVTVTVDSPPVITACPGTSIALDASTTSCGAAATYTVTAGGSPAPSLSYFFSGVTGGSGAGTGSGSFFNLGTTTVTVTATNACGTVSCSFDVVVTDPTDPVITGCPADVTYDITGAGCSYVVTFAQPTVTDNCPLDKVTWTLTGATTESSPATGENYLNGNRNINRGATTMTYTAWDKSGNSTTCSYTITVNDKTAPNLTCPTPLTSYSTDAGKCTASLSFAATATDNCTLQGIEYTIGGSPVSFPYEFPKGTTSVRAVASDDAGNTKECSFNVNVADTEKPQISCASGSPFPRAANSGACNYTVQGTEFDPVSFTDNCAGTTIKNNFNNGNTLAGVVLPAGNTTIIWTATDASGNVQNCTITVSVTDNEKPQLVNCPGNILQQTAAGQTTCTMPVTWVAPTATDNCTPAGSINISSTHSPGQQFPVGTTTITYTARDAAGNENTCSFTVTVEDKTPPTFTAPTNVTIYTTADCNYNASVAFTGDVTNEFDNCTSPAPQAIYTDISTVAGTCAGTFTITRRWTLTDSSGNPSTQDQTITVADNVKPLLTVPPAKTIQCHQSMSPDSTGQATATDNCTGTIDIDIDYSDSAPVNGNCVGFYSVTRTWTATDCSGNVATGTQVISVRDDIVPEVDVNDLNITCIANIPLAYHNLAEFLADGNSATDNCGGPLTFTFDIETPNFPVNVSGYCPTTIVRTYTITDPCGNPTVVNQTLYITNPTPTCQVCGSCAYNNSLREIDLRGNPEGSETVSVRKQDKCCTEYKPNGQPIDPGWCASFNVIIDPDAIGVEILIDGTTPPGQDWKMDCEEIDGGEVVCLPGGSFHLFTYCKKGEGEPQLSNNYTFRSIKGVVVSPDIYARVDCDRQLSVTGITANPRWHSVSPGAFGQWDHFLSDTTSLNPIFTPDSDAPGTIEYRVCGTIGSVLCEGTTAAYDCDIVRVNVKDSIHSVLNLDPSHICGTNFPTLIPNVTPASTYTYEWFSGYDASGISHGISATFIPTSPGPYSVRITDYQNSIYPCSTDIFNFDVGIDGTPPTVVPPLPLVIQCNDPTASQQINNWLSQATATDRGLPVNVTNNYTTFTQGCGTVLTVTFSASDECGNVGTNTSTITVQDTMAPTWITAAGSLDVSLECSNSTGLINAQAAFPVAFDQCEANLTPVKTEGAFVPNGCANAGTYTNTWVVTDACGNTSAVFTQVITIVDTTRPTWTTGAGMLNMTVECGDAAGLTAAQALIPTATDNCATTLTPVKTSGAFVGGSCGNTGTYTNTFTVVDACGNEVAAPYEQVITIVDNSAPAVTCPQDITTNALDGNCFATSVDLGMATGTDVCGGTLTFTNNAPVQFPVGTTEVTWRATDACNNFITCIQKVTIIDNEQPPTITCPVNIVQTALPGDCDIKAVTVPDPVTYDNCAVVLQTWTMSGVTTGSSPATGINVVNGQAFNVGVTTVTYTVADAAGYTATCSFTVTIHDQRIPEFTTCPPGVTVNAEPGLCTAPITAASPVVWDPCNEIVSVANNSPYKTSDADASGTYPVGVHNVIWTITDASGNKNTCLQVITVIDNQPPTIACPPNATAIATAPNCEVPSIIVENPVLTDNCDIANLTISWVKTGATTGTGTGLVNNTVFEVGVTTVNYTVRDQAGHTDECSFTVTVNDQVPPTVVDCPDDVTKNADPGKCDAVITVPAPVVTDPCEEIVSITNNSPYKTSDTNASGTYPVGSTTITWTFTDVSGNTSSCQQVITITDNQFPTLACPVDFAIPADLNQAYASNVDISAPTRGDNCPDHTLTWTITGATTASSTNTSGESLVPSPYPQLNIGDNVITYTITDKAGNSATCSFTIRITSKPDITCPPAITHDADAGDCSHLVDPGLPTLVDGAQPITWTWTITGPTGVVEATGTSSTTTANPTPASIGQYEFKVGTSIVTWTASNHSGIDQCTQEITIIDKEPPVFVAPGPFEFCVENLYSAQYISMMVQVNPDPDHYLFRKGSTTFNLDPSSFTDNCCVVPMDQFVIRWEIIFSAGSPAPASISGTGQPSTYTSDIPLRGDGVSFTNVVHTIRYWISDCFGNEVVTPIERSITIKPRPKVE